MTVPNFILVKDGKTALSHPEGAGARRAVFAAAIGATIEWYDFFLYGLVAALVFGKVFFPTLDPCAGTLLALTTYFVGFAARPIGAALFGHFGDRVGHFAAFRKFLAAVVASPCVARIMV